MDLDRLEKLALELIRKDISALPLTISRGFFLVGPTAIDRDGNEASLPHLYLDFYRDEVTRGNVPLSFFEFVDHVKSQVLKLDGAGNVMGIMRIAWDGRRQWDNEDTNSIIGVDLAVTDFDMSDPNKCMAELRVPYSRPLKGSPFEPDTTRD